MKKSMFMSIVLIIVLAQICSATIINVPSQESTIQAGINAASIGDTVLVADGTYTGDGNRDIDFGGKDVAVISVNGPQTTILDLEGTDETPHRAFNFVNGETSDAKLIGFTIKNGYGTYSHDNYEGGAILLDGASPTIEFCVFIDNDGKWQGGAVSSFSSTSIFNNCTFTQNSARYGGGLYANGAQLTLNNCIIAFSSKGSAVNCIYEGSFTLHCCNLFGNIDGDYVDCASDQADINGNISADPLFCDLDNKDISISASSPCNALQNSCNVLIGAGDIGCGQYLCGDANGDLVVNISDAVYLIGYIFSGGAEPDPYLSGDADCNGRINLTDIVYIIKFAFMDGHTPCDPNGDGLPDC